MAEAKDAAAPAAPAKTGEAATPTTESGTKQEPRGKDAKKTGGRQQSNPMFMMAMLGGLVLLMYFLMIRPQQKREKARQAMIGRLKTGDKVVTASGIIGEIVEMGEADVTLKIDPRKDVRMRVRKAAIAGAAGAAASEQTISEGAGR